MRRSMRSRLSRFMAAGWCFVRHSAGSSNSYSGRKAQSSQHSCLKLRRQPAMNPLISPESAAPAAPADSAAAAAPFARFAPSLPPASPLRAAITAACRRPEPELLPALLQQARLSRRRRRGQPRAGAAPGPAAAAAQPSAGRAGLVQGLLQEFALSSQEGVALMCLAEALLRIPDAATRDALIRDKIAGGQWQAHLGRSPSLFVNAATWGLLLTGRLVATHSEAGLGAALGAPDRARRRAADPQGRRHGDADDGRAVRHRRDHRAGAAQRAPARGRGLSLFVRHARRGGADRARRRSVTCATTSRRSTRSARRRRGAAFRKARASRSSSRPCTRATPRRRTSA